MYMVSFGNVDRRTRAPELHVLAVVCESWELDAYTNELVLAQQLAAFGDECTLAIV